MIEIYKTIEGYEDYEVSNLGNVRSLNYRKTNKEKVLKPTLCRGYEQVCLCKNKIKKMYKVHRLVAQAFIPNPNNLPQVNHKDENKANNMVWVNEDGSIDYDKSNLEWCTASYNVNYGTSIERARQKMLGRFGKECKNSKPICQYTKDGDFVRKWDCSMDARRELGYKHISDCALGKRKTCGGYVWKYDSL